MKETARRKTRQAAICMGLIFVTACSSTEPKQQDALAPPTTEPAVIRVFVPTSSTDEEFQLYFADPVAKKYPHITVVQVKKEPGSDLPELVGRGEIPDILVDTNGALANTMTFGLLENIEPLLRRHKIDIGRFEPVVTDAVRIATKNEQLYGLPYWLNFNALYYNKDIFDKFGVVYPQDGMNWEQAVELAGRLTRSDNGVQYRGMHYETVSRLSMALSPDFVDRSVEKANVNNDLWKRVFELAQRFDAIPNNRVATRANVAFFNQQDTAMLASINTFFTAKQALESGFRMGVAQYPFYTERPNTYGYVDAGILVLSATSKYKDQAMQVIEAATSYEVQLQAARKLLKVSPRTEPEMKTQFGADIAFLQGLELQSIFKSSPAPAPKFSIHSLKAREILQNRYRDVAEGKIDINTALRIAEEEINQHIATVR